MIKSAKRASFAILGSADVTDDELVTAFTGAEALINSRPLTYQSANPSDDTPITPNHFLVGQVGGQFAPGSVDSVDVLFFSFCFCLLLLLLLLFAVCLYFLFFFSLFRFC